ncbi:MAG TPA: hypothetical protein VH834_04325 [Solirubrobacteraceae bacterium]
MSDDALDLAFRNGLPFVGLRDHEHDPQLDTIVPPDAARSARAIPLTFADDHVRLAVADPDADLAALAPYLAGRRVELAIAPRDEVEAILGPPELAAKPSPAAAMTDATPELPVDEAPKEAGPEQPLDEAAPQQLDAGADAEQHALIADPEPPPVTAETGPPAPVAEPDQQRFADESAGAKAEPDDAAAEPHTPAPEPAEAAATPPAGESPSWLEPPRKRSRLRAVGLVLLVLLVLAIIGGAVAAYFLTR